MVEPALQIGRRGGTSYIRAGTGEALLLIHGVGMNSGFWAPQFKAFVRQRDVIAYDMLGHGGSPLPPDPTKLDDYTKQAIDLMDGLGIARATVVGHSMGALVALDMTLSYPERVTSVVAMNAVYRRTAQQRDAIQRRAAVLDTSDLVASRQNAIERWFGKPARSAQLNAAIWVGATLASTNPDGYRRAYRLFARADEAHSGRLSTMQVPALYLTGELDANSTPLMSEQMAQDTPYGQSIVVPGERHMMSLTSVDAVNSILERFMRDAKASVLVAG